MKQPKYTDQHKYPSGYTRSGHTDVAKTFRRIRLEQQRLAEQAAKDQAEAEAKVRTMKRVAK